MNPDPEYNEKQLHKRAAEFYQRIAISDSTHWDNLEDIAPQLRAYEHLIRCEDCAAASQIVDDICFHLISWGSFDRLIAMRRRLSDIIEQGRCGGMTKSNITIANEGGLGLACMFGGKTNEANSHLMRAHMEAKSNAEIFAASEGSGTAWKAEEGKWLGYLAWNAANMGNVEEGATLSRQALEIATQTGDRIHSALWRHQLAWLCLDFFQRIDEALDHLSVAVAEMDGMSSQPEARSNRIYFVPLWGLGHNDLGRVHSVLGNHARAADCFQKAAERFLDVRHRRFGQGVLPGNIGSLLRDAGLPASAMQIYREVIRNQQDIGDRRGELISHGRLGSANRDLAWKAFLPGDGQNLGEAETGYQNAIKCYDNTAFMAHAEQDWRREAIALLRLAGAHRELSLVARQLGLNEKRKEALELAGRYLSKSHRIAPKGFVSEKAAGDSNEVRESYTNWFEHSLNCLAAGSDDVPPVSARFLEEVSTQLPNADRPELVMGIVLLGNANAYDGQGHDITDTATAFQRSLAWASEYAEREATELPGVHPRQHAEVNYAVALAMTGLAVQAASNTEAQDRAEHIRNLFGELVAKHPYPDIVRQVSFLLLMMRDRVADNRVAAIDPLISILRGGMGAEDRRRHTWQTELMNYCWELFGTNRQ